LFENAQIHIYLLIEKLIKKDKKVVLFYANGLIISFYLSGACKDGSDAILTSNPLTNPPCADGSKPKLKLCSCADGTELKPPGGKRPFGGRG
jgi:hypothetical protein